MKLRHLQNAEENGNNGSMVVIRPGSNRKVIPPEEKNLIYS